MLHAQLTQRRIVLVASQTERLLQSKELRIADIGATVIGQRLVSN